MRIEQCRGSSGCRRSTIFRYGWMEVSGKDGLGNLGAKGKDQGMIH